MAIHENLTRVPKQRLREIGWSKATELAKVARRAGERFESATWMHKAQVLPKEEFKREVERHLTGRDTEASELLYFKIYKSQLAVIERALETAALMLGSEDDSAALALSVTRLLAVSSGRFWRGLRNGARSN